MIKSGWTSPKSHPAIMNNDEASAVVGTEEFSMPRVRAAESQQGPQSRTPLRAASPGPMRDKPVRDTKIKSGPHYFMCLQKKKVLMSANVLFSTQSLVKSKKEKKFARDKLMFRL